MHTSSMEGRDLRFIAQSAPRVSWNPVSLVSTSKSAVYIGIFLQRATMSNAAEIEEKIKCVILKKILFF